MAEDASDVRWISPDDAALVAALRDRATGLGCRGMWVLTDAQNEAAVRTYQSAGGGELQPQVMIEWDLT